MLALVLLAGCGADGRPIPPGADQAQVAGATATAPAQPAANR